MHIGIFIPALEGGGERVMLDLAEGLFRRGARVDIVLAQCTANGPYMDQIRPEMRTIDLKATNARSRLQGLMKYLSSENPRALITFYDFLNLASIAKRLARVQTVVISGVHNNLSELFRYEHRKGRLKRIMFPILLSLSDHIVAVSHGVAADLKRTNMIRFRPVNVIYNPALFEQMQRRAREPVDHPFFAPGTPPVVLGIGQLARRKGFDVLIKAFAIVRAKRNAKLMIIGEGPERLELEQLVEQLGLGGDVSLPGLVANPYAYLDRSSVFALCSRFEGLGMVLIEALGLGVPSVATACPSGPSEILEDGRNGILVPVDDINALSEGILQSMNRPRRPEIAVETAERFSLERAVSAYWNLLSPSP